MRLLDEALDASECVISVMGAHAGEDTDAIFGRKIDDCETVGRTFWVAKSAKARPAQVQAICNLGLGYAIFVDPASPSGARPRTAPSTFGRTPTLLILTSHLSSSSACPLYAPSVRHRSTHFRRRPRLGRKSRLGTGIRTYPPYPRGMAATQLDCPIRDRRHPERREPSQDCRRREVRWGPRRGHHPAVPECWAPRRNLRRHRGGTSWLRSSTL